MDTNASLHASIEALVLGGLPFVRISSAPWVADLESRFGLPLPGTFRALLENYEFPALEVGRVELFANAGDGSDSDITVAPFRDKYLVPWLRANRFLHFGRPATGSYDPVCFELRKKGAEPPVVQLDHEDILLKRRKVRRDVVENSLLELLRNAGA